MFAVNNNIGYNPIGNVINMGGGYNQYPQQQMMQPQQMIHPQQMMQLQQMQMGGYYNGMYNNMYNPYLIRQQQQQQQAMMQEMQRHQIDMWKRMSTAVNKYTGNMTPEQHQEHLKMYEPQTYQENEELAHIVHTNKLMNINNMNQQNNGPVSYQHMQLQRQIDYINNMVAESQQYDNMSLAEFMNTAMGDILYDAKMQEYKRRKNQLNTMYNSLQYNQLINQSMGGSTYFNSMYDNNKPFQSNIDISDMEISLPNSIQQELDARKARFLANLGV